MRKGVRGVFVVVTREREKDNERESEREGERKETASKGISGAK